ncbi:MAG: hypothetical protein ABIQ47_02575 [Tepidiformaceae bacterium]
MNLRQSLITRLREEGYPVPADLAEVIERVKSQFGQEVDLTTTEQLFAQTVDLLVFIPSSNGSAAEIGYFAGVDLNPDEDIARRSLVLLDVAHEATPGFVALGPAALLKSQGARVWWVDYGDVGRVWDVVWGEVQAARLRKARRDVVRPKA